jgi:hypothetical protein
MFMKKLLQRSMLFVALVGGLTVCGIDQPSAPVAPPPPNADLLGIDLNSLVKSILQPLSCNTNGYGSVTKTIGSGGGIIVLGPHNLVIPPNALDRNVSITATAPKGKHILVEFQPAGLQFKTSSALTLSYKECGILVLDPKVVYVDGSFNILEQLLTIPNLLGKTATGKVKHFSGYSLAE